jgi:hypothetical protein
MIRIETSEEGGIVTLFLSGRIQKDDLGELKSVFAKHKKSVVLDLSGVNLIDRDAVKFLASFEIARAKSCELSALHPRMDSQRTGRTMNASLGALSKDSMKISGFRRANFGWNELATYSDKQEKREDNHAEDI